MNRFNAKEVGQFVDYVKAMVCLYVLVGTKESPGIFNKKQVKLLKENNRKAFKKLLKKSTATQIYLLRQTAQLAAGCSKTKVPQIVCSKKYDEKAKLGQKEGNALIDLQIKAFS
jgi:hypothetical protein